jgi:hypothetical protein
VTPAALDVLSLLDATRQVVRLDTVAVGASAVGSNFAAEVSVSAIKLLRPMVDVPAGGLEFPFDWGPVLAGTDRLELAPITIDVQADGASDFGGYSMGELATEVDNGRLVVRVPGGRRVRALNLTGLKSENVTLRSEQDLTAAGRRLVVSLPDPRGGWAAPTASVPPVERQGAIPPTLTGASFADGVLRLPDLTGPMRLAVVDGKTPNEFKDHAMTVGKTTGWAAPTPVDLALTGPDGATLWNWAGAMPDGTAQRPDVTVPVSSAAEALRAAGSPITGSLTLTSKFPSKLRFTVSPVTGDLIRDLPGTATVELAGEPVPLPLATPLPPAAPSTVVADVKVTYRGRRLADVSDPLPPAGAQRGIVVRQQRVLRVLPPQALRGELVSRIGLIGFCPEPTALLVRLVAATAAPESAPNAVGTPGTATVGATTTVGVIWVDLPEPIHVDQPVAIEVSAGTGAVYWVTGTEPLIRIVVVDPEPGSRPIVLGGTTLLTVDQPVVGVQRAALPAAAFAADAPVLASALFCTVELTDGELRYPRGT